MTNPHPGEIAQDAVETRRIKAAHSPKPAPLIKERVKAGEAKPVKKAAAKKTEK